MSEPITLLLVDDEPLVRKGFRAILEAEPGLEVVGEASDGDEVEARVDLLHPDVVLMDVRMPRMNGLEATARLMARGEPSPRVLILTTFESDDFVYEALRIGADGFVLKRVEPEELVRAIETVARSDVLLYPSAIRRLATSARPSGAPATARGDALASAGLSEREQDVLRLVARGLSNGEIAGELVVSVETVKSHVASMLAKLGVRDRTQAVIRAYESGFIPRG
ncbi:response regulator transcription factor [Agromyces sp. Marseille-P2726]|uniref:response regulator n=1 Tax=Agromyces sp. Marseille-P2726 TaxID=2709132 RepID=UPI00156EAAA3|nr:response regulator transcription factor [Agromyces sp. Marseille-P2726]